LARGNLQECSFIPKMNINRDEFWAAVKRRTREEDADEILVYMHLMLEKAKRPASMSRNRCFMNMEEKRGYSMGLMVSGGSIG
jgi:hypothetical protein